MSIFQFSGKRTVGSLDSRFFNVGHAGIVDISLDRRLEGVLKGLETTNFSACDFTIGRNRLDLGNPRILFIVEVSHYDNVRC